MKPSDNGQYFWMSEQAGLPPEGPAKALLPKEFQTRNRIDRSSCTVNRELPPPGYADQSLTKLGRTGQGTSEVGTREIRPISRCNGVQLRLLLTAYPLLARFIMANTDPGGMLSFLAILRPDIPFRLSVLTAATCVSHYGAVRISRRVRVLLPIQR